MADTILYRIATEACVFVDELPAGVLRFSEINRVKLASSVTSVAPFMY